MVMFEILYFLKLDLQKSKFMKFLYHLLIVKF